MPAKTGGCTSYSPGNEIRSEDHLGLTEEGILICGEARERARFWGCAGLGGEAVEEPVPSCPHQGQVGQVSVLENDLPDENHSYSTRMWLTAARGWR